MSNSGGTETWVLMIQICWMKFKNAKGEMQVFVMKGSLKSEL